MGFGGYVADHEAAGGSGEAAVGEEGYGLREFGDAFDRCGDGEHLAHAGASAGAFVADDADVVGVDLAGFDGGVAGVLGVEDAGGAGVVEALVAGDLDDAALGGEVALEDDEAAGGLERVVDGVDDGLVGRLDGVDGLFGEGLAGDGDLAAVDEACVEEALGEEAGAAGVLVVLGCVLAAGGEVADVQGACSLMACRSRRW